MTMNLELIIITDTSTTDDLRTAVIALRAKQDRLPTHFVDARKELGDTIDALVDRIIIAELDSP